MKRVVLSLVVAVLLGSILLTGCSEPEPTSSPAPTSAPTSEPTKEPAKTVTLRWAQFATAALEDSKPVIQMAENIETRTNGQYKVELFWSDSLVPMFEAMDAVRTGSAEMATFPFGPFASADIRFASSEMPLMYNTVEAQVEAQAHLMPAYSTVFEEKFNQKCLFVRSIIPMNVGSTEKPIKTMDDWDGMMTQTISPTISKIIEALGGTGAPASPIEVYELLEKGTVDATVQSMGKYVEAMLWEVCPYVTNAGLVPASCASTVNLDVWNKMPKEVQDIIVEEAKIAEEAISKISVDLFYTYVDKMTSEGMEVYNLPKAEREKWQAAVAPIVDDLIAQMGDFGKEVQRTADEANAKYPYPY